VPSPRGIARSQPTACGVGHPASNNSPAVAAPGEIFIVFHLVIGRGRLFGAGMKRLLLFCLGILPVAVAAAHPAFAGRWRLDPAQSTALDGWSAADLVVGLRGTQVELRHDMAWRSTRVTGINIVDTAAPVDIVNFFRIDQRHAAIYAQPQRAARTTAAWLDGERTLRVEAQVPLEVSQGDVRMRIYSEYRLLEGDQTLLLIELHSSRSRPLVYRFTRVPEEAAKK
jgi:hypothetical protein